MSPSYGKWLAMEKIPPELSKHMQCQNNHLDDIEDLPGNEHIIPVGESNSVPPLSSIGIL